MPKKRIGVGLWYCNGRLKCSQSEKILLKCMRLSYSLLPTLIRWVYRERVNRGPCHTCQGRLGGGVDRPARLWQVILGRRRRHASRSTFLAQFEAPRVPWLPVLQEPNSSPAQFAASGYVHTLRTSPRDYRGSHACCSQSTHNGTWPLLLQILLGVQVFIVPASLLDRARGRRRLHESCLGRERENEKGRQDSLEEQALCVTSSRRRLSRTRWSSC